MIKKDILEEYNISKEEIEKEVGETLASLESQNIENVYSSSIKNFEVGSLLKGRVLSITESEVIVDSGYKSEGIIPRTEFDNISDVKVGDEIDLFLESIEDDAGLIKLSKRKADRIKGWETIINQYKEGDVVTGKVVRKIKGGLILDLGVLIFLPASQIDIKPPGDIAEYIGQEVTCKILKIDHERQNIIVSRRKLIEEERYEKKQAIMSEIEVWQIRKGTVKNIADFGVFVDLGGVDGLLHITDMSWGRISHPSEMLAIGDEIEVKVIGLDKEQERISLGLKQKTENPWLNIDEKYPIGTKVRGHVVNIMNYGVFVKLETGVEGLVHISEMSWIKRINHPSETVAIGDEVDVVVLKVDKEKTEISLSMKQTEVNPWEVISEKYSQGSKVKGKVRNITNYGAFIELEEGIDGLLHISDMSWSKKVNRPTEIVKKGDVIETMVLSVNKANRRVALGLKQLSEDPWKKEIPEKYKVGDILKAKVVKLTNFGAFLDLGDWLEGLLHISEFTDKKLNNLAEAVSIGDEMEVKILKIEPEARKIALCLKGSKTYKGDMQGDSIDVESSVAEKGLT